MAAYCTHTSHMNTHPHTQGLLPQVKKSGSLYRGGKPPREPCAETFTVRPYNSDDKVGEGGGLTPSRIPEDIICMYDTFPCLLQELVYQVCLETGDSGDDATNLFSNYPDLLGDRCASIV